VHHRHISTLVNRNVGCNKRINGISILLLSETVLQNNVLHFVRDGSAKLMFSYKRNLYYTPIMLILKCLLDVSDEYIMHQFMAGYEEDTYMKG
jgi:DNA-directed RNA polymerase I subunit RPA2